jgi:hypothetical protein
MSIDGVATTHEVKVEGVIDIAAVHEAKDKGMTDGHCRHA